MVQLKTSVEPGIRLCLVSRINGHLVVLGSVRTRNPGLRVRQCLTGRQKFPFMTIPLGYDFFNCKRLLTVNCGLRHMTSTSKQKCVLKTHTSRLKLSYILYIRKIHLMLTLYKQIRCLNCLGTWHLETKSEGSTCLNLDIYNNIAPEYRFKCPNNYT